MAAESFRTWRGVAGGALHVSLAWVALTPNIAHASPAPTLVAIVNGDSLTTADLDAAVLEMHRGSNMAERRDFDLDRLVDKVINDRLILQQADAMGLAEEPDVSRPVEEQRRQEAVRLYARDRFVLPDSVPDTEVREYFETYYWKLRLEQMTLETEADARAMRATVLAGARWDSLASAHSSDTFRYRGGRHALKYWADVELPLRPVVAALEAGQVSEPFAYIGKHAIVRLVERHPVEEADYERLAPNIRRYLLTEARERAWTAFVAEHTTDAPIARNEEALRAIRADSSLVLRGEFREGSDALVLHLDDDWVVTERELRLAISRSAMEGGDQPFGAHLDAAIRQKTEALALGAAAEQAGYFEHPSVLQQYERDLRARLIEVYLHETLVPGITFRRDEFEAYHTEHAEAFREPEQVQLATLVLDDEATAKEIAERLAGGADFSYIKRQYFGPEPERAQAEPKWSSVTLFSDAIREQIDAIAVGETSAAIDIGHSWLVFKLLDRRPGRVKDLAEVDAEIRQAMFDRKLTEAIDAHLELLESRSEIVRFQPAIDAYFAGGS